MKGKYIIITLLVIILAYTVYKMLEYESSIRQERTIKLYIEDESKPLLTKFNPESLVEAAVNSDYYFAADGNYFKMLKTKYVETEKQHYWEKLLIKGVNLGVAVPGKFPAEFSLTYNEYFEWLELIGEMNANTIRTYTILPPEFYEALSSYNLHHHDKPLYLMQGVWAKIPEDEDYYNVDYGRDFQKEIINMIDVIHGRAVLTEQVGKASGVYATDVSKYVVAFLLGREWEPNAVFKTNQINDVAHFKGNFISMNKGNAMEAWLAKMMDFSILYETQTYRFQHPVSFVNWLPLDPMHHNTEIIENKKVREYDNDLESIDFRKFHATELYFPGMYAAYHAYPYYPDFIYLQESYTQSTNMHGVQDPYFGYLGDLKQHSPGMPLIIAEYGLPSSRSMSHFSPFGFHQGGLSELEQAKLSLSLTQDIVESGCGGAIYFAWIDEWFKHNWLVMDFEQPFEDRKLWHNMENPEQNFGIYAMESRTKTIDGKFNDWKTNELEREGMSIQAAADPSYFYLAAKIPAFDFKNKDLYIAIDTYDEEKGDHKLPFLQNEFDIGFEFLLGFKSTDSAFILVDEPYSVFTDIYNDNIPVYASVKNNNGKFIHQLMLTNRGRIGLLDKKTDSIVNDRSPLEYGNSADPAYSNADWIFDESSKQIEIRLDWHLLNVSNPSDRNVLDDKAGTPEIEYTETDAVNIYFFVTDKNNNVIEQYPLTSPYSYIWDDWEIPIYQKRLKPLYYALQAYFKGLNPSSESKPVVDQKERMSSFEICNFLDNKTAAISISFNNAGFSQYQFAYPILQKYNLTASFGIIPSLVDESPGLHDLNEGIALKRLGFLQIREMAIKHEVALQAIENLPFGHSDLVGIEQQINAHINTLYLTNSLKIPSMAEDFSFVRKALVSSSSITNFQKPEFTLSNANLSQGKLDSLIRSHKNKWLILQYYHLFDDQTEIPSKINEEKQKSFFTKNTDFEKQLRLIRNSNYWISTESNVYKYLIEKNASSIQTSYHQNMVFLRIEHKLDDSKFNQPLTIRFTSSAKTVKIKGSQADGTYSNRTGSILFNALPGKEITLEIID